MGGSSSRWSSSRRTSDGRNTLRQYLGRASLCLWSKPCAGAPELCHGMEHAFSKGVLCHRDIKPDNILISVYFKGLPLPEIIPDDGMITIGYVKITDFGLAAALGPTRGGFGTGRSGAWRG